MAAARSSRSSFWASSMYVRFRSTISFDISAALVVDTASPSGASDPLWV
jgi:hypothetical protein